ncbi:MAG: DivIVA domain-containing protein [Actinomycetota bacterium]
MDLSPQRIRTAEFRTVRKGLDPDQVREYLGEVADELQRAQNEATAMEARARAAVARVQELTEAGADTTEPATPTTAPTSEPSPAASPSSEPTAEQVDSISRTLLLAQRTADAAIADAEREATRLRSEAETESAKTIDSTREMAASLIEEARDEARRESEQARSSAAGEVDSLLARRDFLESDVNHLEQFLVEQRTRLRDAANELIAITDRVPGGLGDVRPPLLSAADDDTGTATPEAFDPRDVRDPGEDDAADIVDPVQAGDTDDVTVARFDIDESAGEPAATPGDAVADDPGDAIDQLDHTPVFGVGDRETAAAGDDEFTFSFDDDKNR